MRRKTPGLMLTTFLLATLALAIGAAPASAQGYCGENCFNMDLDAELGIESLEEPIPLTEQLAGAIAETEANGYVAVTLATLLQAYNFQAYIQGPLRFNTDDFSIREQDWDEGEDFLRILRCARLDYMVENGNQVRLDEVGHCGSWTPEEAVGAANPYYSDFTYISARLTPTDSYSLAYGSIVHGYDAMLEEDHFRDGLALDANFNRWLVVSAAMSDIVDPTVVGGRVAFRPVQSDNLARQQGYWDPYYGWVEDTSAAAPDQTLFVEIGTTVASDVSAPARVNALTGEVEQTDALIIGGIDARIRYTSEERGENFEVIRFELGGEYNRIFEFADGAHSHLRFYYDVGVVDFFVDGEYRLVNGQYIPAYFDQHYRVQRNQYVLSDEQRALFDIEDLTLTKRGFLEQLPDDVEHAYGVSTVIRFWSPNENQMGQVEDFSPVADLALFLEQIPGRDLSGVAGAQLTLHNVADRLRVEALFAQQGWDDLSGLFTLSNSVLEINSIVVLTEDFYLDLFYDQTWFLSGNVFNSNNNFGLNVGFTR